MMMRTIYFIILLFLFSCEQNTPIRDNPLDEESGYYTSPTISLLTDLNNGDTIYSETLVISNELVSELVN